MTCTEAYKEHMMKSDGRLSAGYTLRQYHLAYTQAFVSALKSAVIITASLFLFTGCGKQTEPVNAEPTETVSEVDTEESLESMESMESTEPAPSPTVESTEEPVEESSSNEESEIDT